MVLVPSESELIYFRDWCCPQKELSASKEEFSESILDPFSPQIILLKAASVNASGLFRILKACYLNIQLISVISAKNKNKILNVHDFVAYTKILGIVPATPSLLLWFFLRI